MTNLGDSFIWYFVFAFDYLLGAKWEKKKNPTPGVNR